MEKFFCYALLAVTCLSASTQAVEKNAIRLFVA